MWTCPKCREEVSDVLDNCWNCGVDRNGLEMTEVEKNLKSAMGMQSITIDTRQGIFFRVVGGILGIIFFYLFHPSPPAALGELIAKIKISAEGNSAMNSLVTAVTREPNCYIISGLIVCGGVGYVIDRLIGNGNSVWCRISHIISCSDMDKPIAKRLVHKGMSQIRVDNILGYPDQIVTRGGNEIYVYKYIKIVFDEKKRVIQIE